MGISLGTAVHSGAEMSTSARVWRHPATQPLLAGAVGLVLSLIAIGQPSVWYDEAATVTATTRSWGQLWQMLGTVDAVHGAYYVLIHAVVDVFGYSPTIIRIPSAIAVGAGAALTVLLARQAGAPRLAFLAGLLFCLLPRATWMGTEARSYALSAALAALITLVLITARRSNTWRWWVLYGALTVVSCLVFSYLALVVAAHGVTMLWWWLSRRGVDDVGDADAPHRPASVVLRWFVTTATAGGALVPFFLAIVGQSKQVSWIPPLGEDTPRQVFRTQWFFFDTRFAIVGCVLIVIGAVLLLVRPPGRPVAQIVLPALVLPTVALLVATELFTPLYSPRYLTLCLPFVA
ncbi:MAG: glycosyltransferase family 39 protein, partial [Mycetocola sp.]